MLYAILVSAIVFYMSMAHVCYKYTCNIKRAYYGNYAITTSGDAVLFLIWPINMLAFYLVYRNVIKAVKHGKDWADSPHLDMIKKEDFRERYMRE